MYTIEQVEKAKEFLQFLQWLEDNGMELYMGEEENKLNIEEYLKSK